MKKRIFILLSLCFLALCLFLSVAIIPVGNAAIITQFGKPVATIKEPGLQWKLPGFLQRVNKIDIRIETQNTKPIQLMLGDKNPIIVTMFISWRVQDVLLFFQSVMGPEVARDKLSDMVVSSLGAVLGDYTLDQIINTNPEEVKISDIERNVHESAKHQALEKYGIEVVRVGFRRITYPSIVTEAVYGRMRAEREKEAKKFRAEGAEEAAKIEASTDKEVSGILADAYQQAELIKGEGDKEAARIYAEAYSKDPEFFQYTKSLELYRSSINENTSLIVSTGSDLFKYLTSEQPATQE